MEDQYGMADLRQYMNSRPLYPPIPHPPDLLSNHRSLSAAAHPYDMLIFRSDSTTNSNTGGGASSSAAAGHCFGGFESGMNGGSGDGGAGRWPRQETLTLLEIRSRLDPKFKEANQKGPLWDEVSRIMSEEHGYQRSGKKCREKFENLYKYYKKTKEGKAGRQDGKHYRFFRQLEALYGEANNSIPAAAANYKSSGANLLPQQCPKLSDTSLSLSNYSDAETTSSEDDSTDAGLEGMKMKKRNGWKVKIRDFIDSQMKKLMEKQEAWMEKMMTTIEDKERERMMREEEWRKQDAARIEREHKFWATERAWIEARDAALMEALQKITTGKEEIWPECEINRLIQLRTTMESRFHQRGNNIVAEEEMVWEDIATKMACFGHDRSAAMCKEKWDTVNNYLLKCSKKRKENSKSCNNYFQESLSNQGGVYCDATATATATANANATDHHHHHHNMMSLNNHDHGSSSPNNPPNNISESCFRYFMGDSYGRIID